MARSTPWWKQRHIWTAIVALAALAFWVVGLGAGWRGWVLTPFDQGIVAHAQGFGVEAYIWWVPATIITLTAVVMAVGVSVVRHLAGVSTTASPGLEPVEPLEPLEPVEPTAKTGTTQGVATAPDGDTKDTDHQEVTPTESGVADDDTIRSDAIRSDTAAPGASGSNDGPDDDSAAGPRDQ